MRERDRSEDTLLDAMETKYSSRGEDFLSSLYRVCSEGGLSMVSLYSKRRKNRF